MAEDAPLSREDLVEREKQTMQARRDALEEREARERQAEHESWHFCDELSVNQAALLIVGVSPGSPKGSAWLKGNYPDKIGRLDAVQTALTTAILGGRLKATLRFAVRFRSDDKKAGLGELMARLPLYDHGDDLNVPETLYNLPPGRPVESLIVVRRPDWDETTVMVDDLRHWLRAKGVTGGFFFEPASSAALPGYLDPTHARYAYKLAAAIRAWEAVTEPGRRSLKIALQKWLRENAKELGLTGADGRPLETPIEEIAKLVNWKSEGGAPKAKGNG